jgi:hypothetical protein
MNIVLQYAGKVFRVYSIVYEDGSCPVLSFLNQLKHSNNPSHKSLINVITRHADYGQLFNERKSRHIRGNLYEFKSRQGDRLLYFYMPGEKTIITHGFHKGVPAEREFRQSEKIREKYLSEVKNAQSK